MTGWLKRILDIFRGANAVPPSSATSPAAAPAAPLAGEASSTLDADTLSAVIRDILAADDNVLSCDECFVQIDEFVEMELAGKQPEEALPLVQAHLEHCGNCREEFEALLIALQATRA